MIPPGQCDRAGVVEDRDFRCESLIKPDHRLQKFVSVSTMVQNPWSVAYLRGGQSRKPEFLRQGGNNSDNRTGDIQTVLQGRDRLPG